jgi:hypothetical protein
MHHWPSSSLPLENNNNNKKQGIDEKQILVGLRARGRY